jgi:hypothetical protein
MRYGTPALLLLAAALLIPACGDNSKPAPAPTGSSPTSNVLFSEDFSTVFPGTNWTPVLTTGAGASAIVDGSMGSPGPSLAMMTSSPSSSVATTTVLAFASRSLTVTVQMSASNDAEGSGGIGIFDSKGMPLAVAEWHPASPGAITLRILGNTLGITPPSPGATFHAFQFKVTDSGEASWTLDGAGVPAMTQSGFPSDMVNVQLYDNILSPGASSFAVFRFDNVTVTSP